MNYLYLKPKSVCRKEAIRIALAFSIGIFLQRLFHIQQGFWIMLTIAIIYLAGAAHGFIMARINSRILGSLTGLVFGTYILSLFSFNSHYFLYLSPLFFFLAFYVYFITDCNYFYLTLFLSIYLLMIVGITTPSNHTINLANLNISRIFCTVLGAIILVFVEVLVFPKSTKPKYTTTVLLKDILDNNVLAIESICSHFLDRKMVENEYLEKIYSISSDILDIEKLSIVAGYELNFIDKYEPVYKKIILYNDILLRTIKQLTYISNHYSENDIRNADLIKAGVILIKNKYQINDNGKNLSKHLLTAYFKDRTSGNDNQEEELFMKYLHRAVWSLDRLDSSIQYIVKE
jgi:hypothetical protein